MRFGLVCAVGLSVSASGCSLLSLSHPRNGAPPKEVRQACGGKNDAALYPLADGSWVVLGALDVYLASSKLETEGDPSTRSWLKAQRVFGYTSAILAGISMVHGIAVAVDCASRERPRREMRPSAPEEAARPEPAATSFPWEVLGYQFGTSPAAAKSVCQGSGGVWVDAAGENPAQCQKSGLGPAVRLTFELGSLTELTLVYRPVRERMNEVFFELEGSLQKYYGKGSRSKRELAPACNQSLYACLLNGDRPPASTWSWPDGSIELVPGFDSETPALLIHYAHTPNVGP